MKVSELIEKLKTLPQDAECYYGQCYGFLDENMKRTYNSFDKEEHEVYDIDVEYKTVYTFHKGSWHACTGAIFETG
jgi:hypothetical protein